MIDTTQGQDAKWWGDSLTIRGALLSAGCAVLPALGGLIGLDISGEAIRQIGQQATTAVQVIGGIAGAAMSIVGRLRATKPLGQRTFEVRL